MENGRQRGPSGFNRDLLIRIPMSLFGFEHADQILMNLYVSFCDDDQDPFEFLWFFTMMFRILMNILGIRT